MLLTCLDDNALYSFNDSTQLPVRLLPVYVLPSREGLQSICQPLQTLLLAQSQAVVPPQHTTAAQPVPSAAHLHMSNMTMTTPLIHLKAAPVDSTLIHVPGMKELHQ